MTARSATVAPTMDAVCKCGHAVDQSVAIWKALTRDSLMVPPSRMPPAAPSRCR